MGNILMHTSIPPPDAIGIRIVRFPGFNPFDCFHFPLPIANIFNINRIGHKAVPFILLTAPSANMMGAGHNARFDGFRHPNFIYKPADLCGDFQQISIIHAEPFCIFRVDPDRVSMGNFSQPFSIG